MESMFYGADNFAINASDVPDLSQCTSLERMFNICQNFNSPLNNWDVSNITNMERMFYHCSNFNQPLNDWDVSNVIYMNSMFELCSAFNQPLDNWDVSNVTTMFTMFADCENFNQDLSAWDFNSDVTLEPFIVYSGMDIDNYDALLLRFAELQLEGKTLYSHGLEYCNEGVKNYLVNVLNWDIPGGTLSEECIGNSIIGTVLYDQDANGCDENDLPAYNMLVKAGDGTYNYAALSNNSGGYNLQVFEGAYNIELLLPDYLTASPASSSVTFTGFDNEEVINFCLTANETVEDLNVTLLPLDQARPGFDSDYKLVVENRGTQTVPSITMTFTYDEAIQVFVSASETPATNTAGQLTFTLNNFLPFHSREIDITLNTYTPPTVNGGEIIEFVTSVTPNTNDAAPIDNTFTMEQTVVNSFDPNDKRVLQGEAIFIEQTGEYLDYIIRFQNTGTASAITVRIEDELSDMLDWTTFHPISASHDYELTLTNESELEFTFNNINLPHEAADEPGSHGYIAYKIKPMAGLQVGDIINADEAEIFFDYNLPIITNSTTTEVIEALGTHQVTDNAVQLYPNPADNYLHINANGKEIQNISIYNLQGRVLLSVQNVTDKIDIRDFVSGLYIVSVKTDKGTGTYKLIKN